MVAPINVEALRAQVQAMDHERGTPNEVAQWYEDVAESRANLAIEDMILSPDEETMFAIMLDEGLPPALMPSVILTLYGKGATAPDQAAAP